MDGQKLHCTIYVRDLTDMKLTASRRAGVEQELRRRTLASEKLSICTPLAQTPFPESHLVSSSCGQLSPAAIPIPSTSDFFFGFFGLRLNYISLPGESVSELRKLFKMLEVRGLRNGKYKVESREKNSC